MGLYSEWILPWLCDRELADPMLHEIRRSVLADVSGRILEIGFGSGANLPFYPPAVRRLTTIEPSKGMSRRARKYVVAWGGEIEAHRLEGERLPFEAGSFDSVVITLTLCSVRDPAAVLSETRRVLRPGGGFHFFEHVAASEARALRWQRRLNGINAALAGGCQLLRNSEHAIEGAGFRFERIERGILPGGGSIPRWLFPVVWGKAIAAAT
jgi:SAM-dependent methyltransferase